MTDGEEEEGGARAVTDFDEEEGGARAVTDFDEEEEGGALASTPGHPRKEGRPSLVPRLSPSYF